MESKIYPIDRVTRPIQKFIQQEKSGGIVLGISVIIALILANTPLAEGYFSFLSQKFGFQFNGETYFKLSILHWINDGLMAIFFFVDRKSTRLNSSHVKISYAVFCLKKKIYI